MAALTALYNKRFNSSTTEPSPTATGASTFSLLVGTTLEGIKSLRRIEVTFSKGQFYLMQTKYALDLLKCTNMETTKPYSSPVVTGTKLQLTDGEALIDPSAYRNVAGALQYLTLTRPDLAYAINQDADYAGCLIDHSPTSFYCVYLRYNPISWSAKMQSTVSRSSPESEY
ncbi:uncharacterized mitochondrial protein AtMg00810-like [Cornus florida]|uniref:uncharacterized mitochondrial protein AtMg00810-like n=1 Tax=Cornus florida TaxID=4283 RepID=UPI0028991216|nr:uncharacterized mitochondrial protein AtMg00810-like [Cornus florida]